MGGEDVVSDMDAIIGFYNKFFLVLSGKGRE